MGLRIALASDLAPRKIGSLEETFVEFARVAQRRGHTVSLIGRPPVHPWVAARLEASGTAWVPISDVETSFLGGSRWMRDRFDVLLYTLLPFRGRLALQAAAAWPMRMIYLNGTSTDIDFAQRSTLRRVVYRMLHRRLSEYVCCSEFVRRRDERVFGLDLHDAKIIYNGINIERFRPAPERRPGPPRVMTVLNLIREKGTDVLLDAFARLGVPDARLIIVGRGIEGDNLQAQARALGVEDRVDFLGLRDDVQDLLRDADVFVHPARWDEAFGYSVAEAMASGCAVVSTDRGALSELVEDGVSGLLVPAEDPAAMATAIARLLHDREEAARLGAAALERARKLFSYDRAVADLLAVVEGAAAR